MVGFDVRARGRFDPAPRSWDSVVTPLAPLLNHSDCDGSLADYQCVGVHGRLREIAATWPQDDYDRMQAERLADAMEVVATHGGRIDFR